MLVLLLFLWTIFFPSSCLCVRFDVATGLGILNLQQVIAMQVRIRYFLINEIHPDRFYGPQTWSTTLQIDHNVYCIVGLTLFSEAADGSCNLAPSPMMTQGSHLRAAFNFLVDQAGGLARMYGYSHIMATSGRVSINYLTIYTTQPQGHLASHSQPFEGVYNLSQLNSTLNSTRDLYDQNDCYPFRSGMTSGERGELGSDLYSGSRLVSPNGFYELVLEYNCNLVLLARGWKELWSSSTAGKGVGCVLTLQRDGNLVLIGGDGRGIFASNIYCQPQPHCILGTNLVLENSGSISIYRASEPMLLLWRRP